MLKMGADDYFDLYTSSYYFQLKKSLRCLRQNKHVYNQRQNAAVRIQTYYRRKACQSKFLAILKCCIQLQSIVRSYQLRVRQLKIERLCVKLQSFVRMVLTRKCFLSKRRASLQIQSTFRMAIYKNRYHCKIVPAIIRLQSFARMVNSSQNFYLLCNASARIMKRYRSFRARKQLKHKIVVRQEEAAIKIQKIFRGWKFRVEYLSYLQTICDVIMCQSVARKYLACKKYDSLRQSKHLKSVMGAEKEKNTTVKATIAPNSNTEETCNPKAEIQYHILEEKGFANYVLRVSDSDHHKGTSHTIKRRYKEFYAFNKQLRHEFDTEFYQLPTIPPKTWCRNTSEGFLERRATQLDFYLKRLAINSPIAKSSLFKAFLGES